MRIGSLRGGCLIVAEDLSLTKSVSHPQDLWLAYSPRGQGIAKGSWAEWVELARAILKFELEQVKYLLRKDASSNPTLGPRNNNREKTRCKHGHPFTPENTILHRKGTSGQYRGCRECEHLRYLKKKSKKKSRE